MKLVNRAKLGYFAYAFGCLVTAEKWWDLGFSQYLEVLTVSPSSASTIFSQVLSSHSKPIFPSSDSLLQSSSKGCYFPIEFFHLLPWHPVHKKSIISLKGLKTQRLHKAHSWACTKFRFQSNVENNLSFSDRNVAEYLPGLLYCSPNGCHLPA